MNTRFPLAFLAAVLLSGCAQTRLLPSPAADQHVALGWSVEAPGKLQVMLEHVIVRDGPGSWVRDADWDEYVLKLRNAGQEPVILQAIELESEALGKSAHVTDREALEDKSRKNLETLKTLGTVVVVGAGVMGVALAAAAVETSIAISSLMGGGGGSAGASAFMAVAPVAIMVAGGLAYRNHARRKGDRAAIAYELERVGLNLPTALPAGGNARGSAFFPLTPAPTRLRIRYEGRGVTHEAILELKPLAGLHLAQPEPGRRLP